MDGPAVASTGIEVCVPTYWGSLVVTRSSGTLVGRNAVAIRRGYDGSTAPMAGQGPGTRVPTPAASAGQVGIRVRSPAATVCRAVQRGFGSTAARPVVPTRISVARIKGGGGLAHTVGGRTATVLAAVAPACGAVTSGVAEEGAAPFEDGTCPTATDVTVFVARSASAIVSVGSTEAAVGTSATVRRSVVVTTMAAPYLAATDSVCAINKHCHEHRT